MTSTYSSETVRENPEYFGCFASEDLFYDGTTLFQIDIAKCINESHSDHFSLLQQ